MTRIPFNEVRSDLGHRAAVVVAHPDDETLWCGGYILTHPGLRWRIVTLCRALDPDRAPKFRRVLERLGAEGEMADLDDGPDQAPLPFEHVQETTARLLAGTSYDLSLTFGDQAESTQNDCGCLHTRTGGGRTCLAFATMPIGETGWQTTSGSKSAA
jgi:LmbE family N-acetylglucosaminyl deacetylase